MNKLLNHVNKMQTMAAAYVEPTPSYTNMEGKSSLHTGLEGLEQAERNWLFSNDMIYMLDGPEEREAIAEASFNYEHEAAVTLSSEFHGDKVDLPFFLDALTDFAAAANKLDRIKKAFFYGRTDQGTRSLGAIGDCSTIPHAVSGSDAIAAQIINGVIGTATEAGELIEALLNALADGKMIDTVNIKEEVGDCLWYQAVLGLACGFTIEQAERTNIAKLRERFKDKFSKHDENNRRLDAERAILESGAIAEYEV